MRAGLTALLTLPALAAPPVPAPSEFQLPSGMHCQLLEDHQRPLVRLEVRVRMDPSEAPPGWEGMGLLLSRMLELSGMEGMSREAFARVADEESVVLGFKVEGEDLVWTCLTPSYAQDAAFHCLAQAVTRPRFDAGTLLALKQTLREQLDQPKQQALELFSRSLEAPLSGPTASSLARIGLAELDRYRRRMVRPANMTLRVYGDLNLDQLRQSAALEWGAWGPGPEPALLPQGASQLPSETLFIWVGDAPRAEVWVGMRRPKELGRPGASLLARQALREAAAGSPLELQGSAEGPWRIQAPSWNVLQDWLKHQREKTWTPEDLKRLRRALEAERLTRALHPERTVEGPGSSADLEALNAEDLQQALRARLEVSNLRWLVLGISDAEAASLQKDWPGPVKVMPAHQIAEPDPGSAPARRK